MTYQTDEPESDKKFMEDNIEEVEEKDTKVKK